MKKVLIFACDPGGANAVTPLIKEFRNKKFSVSLFGKNQALEKYRDLDLSAKNMSASVKAVSEAQIKIFLIREKPDIVVTGTSANDKTEKYLWAAARELNIPSFAVLDQWVNYGIRFSQYGVSEIAKYESLPKHEYLPNKIFVMDDYAKRQLKKIGIGGSRVIVSGQPYFETLRENAKKITSDKVEKFKLRHKINLRDYLVTFASEPISRTYGANKGRNYLGYTEKTIIKALILSLRGVAKNCQVTLIIKPHPKEAPADWQKVIQENPGGNVKVTLMKDGNIWELMKASDLVCGMTSMFLVEAVILNRPALSIQVGRKHPSGFILEQRGILKPALNQDILNKKLARFIAGKIHPNYSFKIIPHPGRNIVNYLQKYYV